MFYFDFPVQIQSALNHYWLLINYLLFFLLFSLAYVAYKKPAIACGILILLFPAYLFRTKIFGIPTTFLEISFIAVFIPWFIKNIKPFQVSSFKFQVTGLKYPIILFLVASTVSIFTSPNTLSALGLWKAYFIEPVLLFFLFVNVIKTQKEKEFIFWCLGASTIPIAVFAIFQKFTGWGIAEPMWIGENTRRVTAIFTSPNAVGLYLGPIAVIYFGWIIKKFKVQSSKFKVIGIFIILLLNVLAILFTKSQGTWAGVLAGIIFLCYFLINKKWTAIAVASITIAIIIIPQTQKILLPYITFSDQSGQNRVALWKGSMDYLASSPKNFLLGSGIFGFPKVQENFRDPKKIEPLIYPHNIFLNFWMDTGILGLIAIVWILFQFFKRGFTSYHATRDQAQPDKLQANNRGRHDNHSCPRPYRRPLF